MDQALAAVNKTEGRWSEAELHHIKGELFTFGDAFDSEQAEICFRQAIAVARRHHARSVELRAAMSLARLWHKQGKKEQARELLGGIYNWFTEGFDTTELKAAKALLDELA